MPAAAVALVTLAVVVTVLLLFTTIGDPYVGGSGLRLGAFLLLLPPALLLAGAAAAWCDRAVRSQDRARWALASAALGVICVPAVLVLATVISGP
ncbi:hypothetical protein [Nesterenkonia sp. NBAIMH1]|uniref:hypothetical protein n=1 Tax=Nesterenkonia sp. NBAIMH1 TaxID=2600320 RepID=UPI0011B5D342|nr:hypothetical protein [Nesterenkonia sp. NBAIMH1]